MPSHPFRLTPSIALYESSCASQGGLHSVPLSLQSNLKHGWLAYEQVHEPQLNPPVCMNFPKKPLTRVSKPAPGSTERGAWRGVGREGWPRVGDKLAKGWRRVGGGLGEGWWRVGGGLADGWQRVGGFPCTLQLCNS